MVYAIILSLICCIPVFMYPSIIINSNIKDWQKGAYLIGVVASTTLSILFIILLYNGYLN
jgi:hypothetical protein